MSTAKTQPPTPHRLHTLRRQGEVAVSAEFNRCAALAGALCALLVTGPITLAALVGLTRRCMGAGVDPINALWLGGQIVAEGALPIAAFAAFGGVVAGAGQTGWVFAPGRVLPQAARFRWGEAWRSRLRSEAWIGALIALVALGLGAGAGWLGVSRMVSAAPELSSRAWHEGVRPSLGALVDTLTVVMTAWIGIALAVAGFDFGWRRQAFLKRHAMSRQEIRDEHKRSEGDPRHKAHRRQAHRALLAGDIRQGVARADVLVSDASRLAVGLRYRPHELDAPVVMVSGRGSRAQSISREGRRAGVPEYLDGGAARSLASLDVGDPVPESLFEPVAIIFKWLGAEDER